MNRESLLSETCQRFEEKFPGGSDSYVAGLYLECLLECVADTLESGETITIRGLGSISVEEFSARKYSVAGTASRRLTERRVFRFVPDRRAEEIEDDVQSV